MDILQMLQSAIQDAAIRLRQNKLSQAIYKIQEVINVGSSDDLQQTLQNFRNELTAWDQGMGDSSKLELEVSEIIANIVSYSQNNYSVWSNNVGPLLEQKKDEKGTIKEQKV